MIKLSNHSFFNITGKYHGQSAILPMSVNLAVLRTAIVVRIPVSGNRKNHDLIDIDDHITPCLHDIGLLFMSDRFVNPVQTNAPGYE